MSRAAKSISLFLFMAMAGLGATQSSLAQGSRQNPPRQQAGGSETKQDDETKPTLVAKFRVLLKDGKTYEAAKTETLRNGNIVVTLADGKTVTITKADLDKIEEIANPASPPQTPRERRPDPPAQQQSGSTGNSQSGNANNNQNTRGRRDPAGQSAAGNPSTTNRGISPQPVSSVLLAMADGQNLTATSVRQTSNGRWQATMPDGTLRNLDPSRIESIKTVGGEFLSPVIGPNGEITWTKKDPPPANSGRNSPAPGVATNFYDTFDANANAVLSGSSWFQDFLAAGTFVESVEIRTGISNSLELKLVDVNSNQVLAEQVVTSSANGTTTYIFSPAIAVTPGNRIRAMFRVTDLTPGSNPGIKTWLTTDEEYVFSGANRQGASKAMPFDEHRSDLDLVMRVKGKSPAAQPTASPSQRALLVLLENDGIISSLDAAKVEYPDMPDVKFMVFAGEGGTEFKLNKNESVAQALTRVSSQLQAFAEKRVGPMPQPPVINGVPNPIDPDYIAALNAWQSSVQAMLLTLTNPNNWSVRTESFSTFTDAVSDLLVEQFTAANIMQKTAGKYQHVVVLEDSQFGAANVLAKLKELAPNYQIEIHVLSHGGINVINGAANAVQPNLTRDNFFIPLQQARLSGELPLRLRAVYQCNCVGGTLKREWLGVGAQVVGGTKGEIPGECKNNYMPQQYLYFLDYWCNQNQTMQQALAASFNDAAAWSEGLYSAFSDKADLIEDSRMTLSGDGSVKRN